MSRRSVIISALAPGDERTYEISVAGPAALLVAKTHKLAERIDANDIRRISNKDAFDIFRLLRAVDTGELTAEIRFLEGEAISATVAAEAMVRFRELFGTPRLPGPSWSPSTWPASRTATSLLHPVLPSAKN